MKKFEPFYIKENGTVTYRFVYRNNKISTKQFSKTLSFREKPSQRTLEAEYWKWRDKIENKKIQKDSEKTLELFDYYLSQRKYQDKYKYNINLVRQALSQFGKIQSIKRADCRQTFEFFRKERKEISSKRIYSLFSAFLSWCVMMDYIEYNPALKLKINVKENRRTGTLTQDQKKEVLEKSKVLPHLHLAILIAMMTGLRKGEILALQWTWIDFNHGTLRIPQENTKNKKGFYIALSSKLLEILKQERLTRPSSTHVIEYYGKPITDNIKHSFDRLRKQLSFQYLADGERFTFHHLRHTFATELAQSGLPLVEVKNALNHSDIQTTLRYAHSTGKGVVEAIDKINEGLV